mgnify:CR=1 FL=1
MIYRNGKVRDDTLGFYGPDLYVQSLIEFMKADRDGPFFAYYSMALCHEVTDDLEEPVPHGPFRHCASLRRGRHDSFVGGTFALGCDWRGLSPISPHEPLSIGARREADVLTKGAVEMALVVEAAVEGDFADRSMGFFKMPTGHEEAHAQEVVSWTHAEEALKLALELTDREVGDFCEAGHGEAPPVIGQNEPA